MRKDINEDFPLRGFVLCGDCGEALTACWSTSRSGKKHPYYLCGQRECPSKRKSIRRADIEEPFEQELKALRPQGGMLSLCKAMFLEAWNLRAKEVENVSRRLKQEAVHLQEKIDSLVDRMVEADAPGVVAAYEARIERLQNDKRLLEDRVENTARPVTSFEDTFEHALRFLANSYEIWSSGHLGLRRTVLRLVFAEPISFCRKTCLRTAKTTLPFNALQSFSADKCGMVDPSGIEPLTSCMPCRRSPS